MTTAVNGKYFSPPVMALISLTDACNENEFKESTK